MSFKYKIRIVFLIWLFCGFSFAKENSFVYKGKFIASDYNRFLTNKNPQTLNTNYQVNAFAFNWNNPIQTTQLVGVSRFNGKKYLINEESAAIFNSKLNAVKAGFVDVMSYKGTYSVQGDLIISNNSTEAEKDNPRSKTHSDFVATILAGKKSALANSIVYSYSGFIGSSYKEDFINNAKFWSFSFSPAIENEQEYYTTYNKAKKGFNFLSSLAKKVKNEDYFIAFSVGNYGIKEPSLFPSYLIREYEALEGVIAVGIKPVEIKSNSCGAIKRHCLFVEATYVETSKGKNLLASTSFTTPRVLGLATALKSINPFLKNYQIKDAILTTAVDVGEKGIDERYGWGLLNYNKALGLQSSFTKKTDVFDLSYDNHLAVDNAIYSFNNVLNDSNVNLTFKNALKKETINFNKNGSISGNINFDKANVNIDGNYPNLNVNVKEGSFFGAGKINSLSVSNGNLFGFSFFANSNKELFNPVFNKIELSNNSNLLLEAGSFIKVLDEAKIDKSTIHLTFTLLAGKEKINLDFNRIPLVMVKNSKGLKVNLNTIKFVVHDAKTKYRLEVNNGILYAINLID